ncbi:MAG TPA: DinB family protein [Candidatus Dormibacteraeota bacterium]|nr:DinB family protein [Candidatus Dormibacteraeota bacterium]
MDPLGALFDHHAWATLRLIDHCAAFPADQLQATVPGTYGTIERTLIHLVAADQRYLQDMDGQPASVRISERESYPLTDVRAAADLQAARWTSLVRRAPELNVTRPAYDEDPDSPHAEDLLFLQAIHHGNDHRTQICTILGAHGLEVPDLSGWAYWHEQRSPAG